MHEMLFLNKFCLRSLHIQVSSFAGKHVLYVNLVTHLGIRDIQLFSRFFFRKQILFEIRDCNSQVQSFNSKIIKNKAHKAYVWLIAYILFAYLSKIISFRIYVFIKFACKICQQIIRLPVKITE